MGAISAAKEIESPRPHAYEQQKPLLRRVLKQKTAPAPLEALVLGETNASGLQFVS